MRLSMRLAVIDTDTGIMVSHSEQPISGVSAEEWARTAGILVERYLEVTGDE